jgi:hypothetical protein
VSVLSRTSRAMTDGPSHFFFFFQREQLLLSTAELPKGKRAEHLKNVFSLKIYF